jgi:hypothetical protein
MTQEQKDLLLKDLCARLSYGVKVKLGDNPNVFDLEYRIKFAVMYGNSDKLEDILDITNIKPYLFPLSSMTEEQWIDTPYANLNKYTFDSFKCGCSTLAFETYEVNLSYVVEFINWCYKNHFDIYGLIPMGLANDATGLNIY